MLKQGIFIKKNFKNNIFTTNPFLFKDYQFSWNTCAYVLKSIMHTLEKRLKIKNLRKNNVSLFHEIVYA